MGESKNGFVISDHTDSSPLTEDPKKDHLPWQRYARVPRGKKKKKKTDPHGEDRKTKQHKHEWIYEMYIFRFET